MILSSIVRCVCPQGMVLLKNTGGRLPLRAGAVRSLALVGPQVFDTEQAFLGNYYGKPEKVVCITEAVLGCVRRAGSLAWGLRFGLHAHPPLSAARHYAGSSGVSEAVTCSQRGPPVFS
jgi:hypothetical protein